MKSVLVPAYAKVNLCLEVLGRRADGYHELRTIFQTITLRDTLGLEVSHNTGIDLRIVGNSALARENGPTISSIEHSMNCGANFVLSRACAPCSLSVFPSAEGSAAAQATPLPRSSGSCA